MQPNALDVSVLDLLISIHAPYNGCNYSKSKASSFLGNFNPCTL